MKRNITDKNLYLILPGKVSRMAGMYAAETGISVNEALSRIYRSATYRELEHEESKLWHHSPVDLYHMVREEE
ncbi:MAG: hypothetical protein NC048_07485 [Bacteroides sp.]|nr:hypothetical protein [Ruminococcus flavefaciens]MCM1555322.1 hypothetical protein [Bacteroides sp.]